MPLEVRKFGALNEVFSDIHGEEENGQLNVEVTFAIDATVENLAVAFYMDGSGSMESSGVYGRKGGLFGLGKQKNLVDEAMKVSIPYLAQKDANGSCRVAYWACGPQGDQIEPLGEVTEATLSGLMFAGPKEDGGNTLLLPAVRDFVQYIKGLIQKGERVDAALGVIVTDGHFHDSEDVIEYTHDFLAKAIVEGKFPKTVFTVVGIGNGVNAEMMEEFSHEATPADFPGREIWCYALASEITALPQLVAHLVDANTPAFHGGARIEDEQGRTVKTFEDMVPTVIAFPLPTSSRSFTLVAGDKRITQRIEVVEAEHHEG
ncbi:vWA domain-containing protein [Deinococcus cellulosilyticus]|uniref:VWFA domain-containing protein n=1 Tax=Deinococcus cellulosilyticus (strain DSM 18568 / NBRC 106333 / KACC 11606 / 5516J-15) TaxID=1223518 RepID=A0A511N2L8_DEIC1|nr:vWA domain-containing protein [Deinococcus cellulosilyticus]GEM46651.1 hypothetical protein DC3_22860 [Deinococcus cellulosilyticus NBRC 106333 = KACC 11606]